MVATQIARLPECEEEAVALAQAARDAIIGEGEVAVDGDCERACWLLAAVHPEVQIWHGLYRGEAGHNIVKAGDWFIDITADQFGAEDRLVWSTEEQEMGLGGRYGEYVSFARYPSSERYARGLGLQGTAIVAELAQYEHGPALMKGAQ